jgi:outer membrane protein assembly factor BamB
MIAGATEMPGTRILPGMCSPKFFRRSAAWLFCIAAAVCSAAGWPEWRGGPARDGTWNEPALTGKFSSTEPKIVWRETIGTGYSGPSVADGRLYVIDRLKPPAAEVDTERVLCFDARTGEPLWTNAYACALKFRNGYENGPRSTPTVRDGKVFTLGSMARLVAHDAKTGKVLWDHDLKAELGVMIPFWGVANSPLVEGSLVIVQAGSTNGASVMAFDRDTGKEAWRSLNDHPGYASILPIDAAGRRQLVVWTGESVCSLEPKTGEVIWRVPKKLFMEQAVASPLYSKEENVLLISADREGTLALRPTKEAPGVTTLWDSKNFSTLHSNPVLFGGHLYGVNHNGGIKAECGELRCIDLQTGDIVWRTNNVTRMGMHTQATTTRNAGNGLFYISNELGEIVVGEATTSGWKEISRQQIIGKTWSHPAYVGKRAYLRAESALVCVELE